MIKAGQMAGKSARSEKERKKRRFKRVLSAAVSLVFIVLAVLAIRLHWFDNVFSSCVDGELDPIPLPKEGCLSIYVLDVGQGDCSLLVSPNGRTMLIDAGDAAYSPKIISTLEGLGVYSLDVAVGTHPHFDHIGGMPTVLNAMPVGEYWMPEVPFEAYTQSFTDRALEENGVKTNIAWNGKTIDWDKDCVVTVLSPARGVEYSDVDANDYSIILRVEYGENAMLFTGDATVHAEQLAMYQNEKTLFDADVLKVAHHGSTTGSSYGFLEAVSAKTAVISVGRNNDYGHPDFDILNRLRATGSDIFRTDKNGTISVFMDGRNVSVEVQKHK